MLSLRMPTTWQSPRSPLLSCSSASNSPMEPGGAREEFVGDLLATIPVEDYNLEVARAHARLLAHVRRTGKPRGAHDLIIAATAAATARTVVSSDATGFEHLPDVAILDASR